MIAPPRPARPAPQPPAERLPGLWLPDGARLAPSPSPRPDTAARRGLDLSLGSLAVIGRNGPEPQVSIRGADGRAGLAPCLPPLARRERALPGQCRRSGG